MSGTFPLGPSWNPSWVPGYVPPAAEWNAAWSNKLDSDDAKLTGAPWLPEGGGTMTGPLVLYGPPTQPLQAATKAYVDAITPASGPFLPMSGGTMTGPLTLALDPSGTLDAVTKRYADAIGSTSSNALTIAQNALQRSGGTMTGPLTLSGDPGSPLVAATKQYVDRFLPLTGGNLTGSLSTGASADLVSGRDVYASYRLFINPFNGWEWYFIVDTNGDKMQYYRNGWYDYWSGTDGSRNWIGPGGPLMQLNSSGTLWTNGTFSVGSNGINYRAFSPHVTAFGYDGTYLQGYADGSFVGDLATTNYVAAGLAAYLPLSGGHVTGALTVNGATTIGGALTVNNSSNAAQIAGYGINYPGMDSGHWFGFWYSGSSVGLRINGATDLVIGSPSDERFKDAIVPSTFDGLAAVRRVPLFGFSWKEGGGKEPIGFVAQRLAAVFPEAAYDTGKTMGVNVNTLLAALCGAVQTLADRLDAFAGAAKEA